MKCPNCGEDLSDGVLFCRECGCKIQKEPQKRFCRECGSELESGAKFCSNCGAKVLTQTDIEATLVEEVPECEDETNIVAVEPNPSDTQTSAGYFQRLWNKLDGYLKFCVIALAFFLFGLLIACIAHRPIAILASIVQIGCLLASVGIYLGIVKTDKKWLHLVLLLVILVMFSPYFRDFKAKDDSSVVIETSVPETAIVATTESAVETTVGETEYILADDEIIIDFSKYDLMVENYEDVTYWLNDLGFTSISYRIQYDIVWGITKEGEVASVSIAGRTDYKKGDVFKADDPVVISYHMKEEKDPSGITEPIESSVNENKSESVSEATSVMQSADDDEIITIENNEDFKTLMALDALDTTAQSNFANKYKNKIIEFDGFVYYMEQNEKYDTLYSYIFVPGESDNITGTVMFGLENANAAMFKWDSKTRPSYLTLGSKVRMRAEVQGATELYIKLKPVCTWGR